MNLLKKFLNIIFSIDLLGEIDTVAHKTALVAGRKIIAVFVGRLKHILH